MNGIPHATTLPRSKDGLLLPLAVLGAGITAVVIVTDPPLGWAGLLTAGVFGVTVALGGALFASIFAATGATWWHPIRSVPLSIAGTLPVPLVAVGLVVALGVGALYPWADPEVVAHNHLIHGKTSWLNHTFFAVRAIAIALIWLAFVAALRRKLAAGERIARLSIGFLIAFALTISVAFWDWVMSLEPEWFSTMFGVYGFAGAIHAGIAATALWTLRRRRSLGCGVGTKQVHTLGSLLFAFAFFWGYIWFCQAMLIWYANIPEETLHYAARLSGGWTMLFWLNPILNLALPFFVLMPVKSRQSPSVVSQVALVVLVGHWLDVVLLVGPSVAPAASYYPWAAVGATALVVTAMLYMLRRDRRLA